mmetsp:Transcript_38803/g.64535  ORF Transcript_38803/g.64535 Transcript_38803/m.64535 type:complete len:183 (-) Transcript_38803:524-1072(-)
MLKSSNYYVTVCTTRYPQGEIRGQLVNPDKIFITPTAITGPPAVQAFGFATGVLVGNTFTVGGYFVEVYFATQITTSKLLYGPTTVATLPIGSLTQPVYPYKSAYFGPKSVALTASQVIWLKAGLLKVGLSTATATNAISGGLESLVPTAGSHSTHSFVAHAHTLFHAHKAVISNHFLSEAN